jgi:predicted ATPase with chaperone activity
MGLHFGGRLTAIFPAMRLAEALEMRRSQRPALVTTRPCRAPHHAPAVIGLIGGGPVLRSGGAPAPHVEDGVVTIVRVSASAT